MNHARHVALLLVLFAALSGARPAPAQSRPASRPLDRPDGPASRPTSRPASRPASRPTSRPTSRPASRPAVAPAVRPADWLQRTEGASTAFDELLADRVDQARKSASVDDDIALAEKLMRLAEDARDDAAFVTVLCRKAYELSSKRPAGHAVALLAMDHAMRTAPWDADIWLEQVVVVRQAQYLSARGEDRAPKAEVLIASQARLAQALADADRFADALAQCRKALGVAQAVKSQRTAFLQQLQEELSSLKQLDQTLAILRTRLKANPKDQSVRNELVRLYVVERDDPVRAAEFLNAAVPESYRKNLPDAAKPVHALDEAACRRLGAWYHGLAGRAGPRGKRQMLERAQGCLQRYLALHDKSDPDRLKAKIELENVGKALAALHEKKTTVRSMRFHRALHFTSQWSRLVSNPSRLFSIPYRARTIDMWVRLGKDDGLLVDHGSTRAGMALCVSDGKIHFAMCDGKKHEKKVIDDSKRGKDRERWVPIPAGVLSAPIPARDKWFHVAAQYLSGTMSLWIDGKLTGTRRIHSTIPGDSSGTAIGGANGSNAGYWSGKGFAGKIASVRFSSGARYTKEFKPEELLGTSSAFAFLCGDRFVVGEIDSGGTRDSVSAGRIKWTPAGTVRIISAE